MKTVHHALTAYYLLLPADSMGSATPTTGNATVLQAGVALIASRRVSPSNGTYCLNKAAELNKLGKNAIRLPMSTDECGKMVKTVRVKKAGAA